MQGAHMQESRYALALAGLYHLAGQFNMGVPEATAIIAWLVEDPDQVDNDIAVDKQRRQLRGVMNITLDRLHAG